MKQKVGEPLDPEKVRADERRLFATGLYVDISVDVVASGNGVAVEYVGKPQYFVGRVTIEGVKNDRLASLLEFATRLDPGVPFTDDALPTAVEAVKESLAENGFFIPTVALATTVDDAARQVNATFTVNTGPQARVGSVAVEGADAGIDVPLFRKKGHLDCGWVTTTFDKTFGRTCILKVTRETTSNALSGVRSYYQKEDRLEGTISLQKSNYAAPRRQVDYDFSANQGPVVQVVVNGVKLSTSRTKLLVPVYEEGAVDIDLLNEGAFNIKDYLQQRGYFNVTDKVQLVGKGTGHVQVEYTVDPGKKHKVTEVKLQGNKYFDRSTLEDVLRVKKADSYQRSGRYSAQLLAEDVNSIESLYRANGFSAVKVTSTVTDEDKGPNGAALKEAQIRVTFTIVEGPQQKFGSVELTGVAEERRKAVQVAAELADGTAVLADHAVGRSRRDPGLLPGAWVRSCAGGDHAACGGWRQVAHGCGAAGDRGAAGERGQGAAVGDCAHAAEDCAEPDPGACGRSAGPGSAVADAEEPVQPGAVQRGECGGAGSDGELSGEECAGAVDRSQALGCDVRIWV